MYKLLLLFLTTSLLACSSTKSIVKSGNFTCTAYSYMHLFDELKEEDRYIDKVMRYENDKLIWEQEYVRSGDSSNRTTYFYNESGSLDSSIFYRQGEKVKSVFYYTDGVLTEKYDIYNGMSSIREMHIRTDSTHKILNYLGGFYSNTSILHYNSEGQNIKTELYSPEGQYWGKYLYSYNTKGLLTKIESFNSSDEADEITEHHYDKRLNMILTEIHTDKGQLIEKLKYEYSK